MPKTDDPQAGVSGLLEAARATAPLRRRVLLDSMRALGERKIDCSGCSGVCCTFVANSMQITPIEALDILADLTARGEMNEARLEEWRILVERHGLDRPAPGDGQRELVRRRYTCSFFAGGKLGCTLTPEFKPYGCLAFKPRSAGVWEGKDCGVDGDGLARRDIDEAGHLPLGESLAAALADLAKGPIPAALLNLAARLGPSNLP